MHNTKQAKKKVKILLSRHYDPLSQFIYYITGKQFTHASVGLEGDDNTFYSFNGKGFRIEKPTRWKEKDNRITARVYELEVSEEAYDTTKQYIDEIKKNQNEYKYSFIGLAMCIAHIPFNFSNRYFCSQFVAETLIKAGILDLSKKSTLYLPNTFTSVLGNNKYTTNILSFC